jgi:hypothetical protein
MVELCRIVVNEAVHGDLVAQWVESISSPRVRHLEAIVEA